MTNKEAIHIIKNINANTNCDNCFYKYDATCEDCRVETALNIAIEALENQKTLKEELEKIKKKIKKIYDDEYLSNWITTRTLNVIDERIAELKGE